MLAAASDVTFAAGTELSLRVSLSKKFLRRFDEEPTRRWGEGSYGKSCFKAVSERGRCWQLILVRAEGGKKVWDVSQVLCGERHWRSSNPVALSPLTVHAAITVRGVPTRASCSKQNRKEAVTMHTPLESMYNTMHHTLRKSFQQVGIKASR
jgi:hypothetical protein